jgi:phosphatidylinositol-3,4,5-trisphosphate 3-phosphatase/dual-specificity protein phosphatase PTEN
MGYPAEKVLQAFIRNPIEKVSNYLKEKHLESFKIYNLCEEKDEYDLTHFDNNVEKYPMEDHNPPNFIEIEKFCTSVEEWLNKNEKNVAIIHCKAGKVG